MNTGRLSVVATPIGNLEDMTLRAIRVLKEADYVLCEDTRVTGHLLKHHEIETKTRRYDAHASDKVHDEILRDLSEGKHIALVSDAGTPGVSDPGVFLVKRIRKELPEVRIDAIPGPSAVTAAFSIAGIAGNQFAFLGFVPQKKGRETFFKNLKTYELPVIFFESTHRIMKTLSSLKEHVDATFKVTIGRELSKLHEEMVSGTADEVYVYYSEHTDKVRGEFVVIVSRA